MLNLTKEVKQFVLDQGMDLVDITSANRLNELTPEEYSRPKDILAECKNRIVIGLRWPDPLVDRPPEIRTMYSRIMIMMNNQLDQTLLHIARFLTKKGFLEIPVYASDPFGLREPKGVL